MRAIGVVFSNIHDHNVPELVSNRTVGSIPFGGRYRLVDFVLSNMVNSNIDTVGVITKRNYQSLMQLSTYTRIRLIKTMIFIFSS